jgi:hypothetical protein
MRIESAPMTCLHDAHALLRLLEEERIGNARIPRLYYDTLQIMSTEMHRERHMVNLWSGNELVLFTMRGCQQSIYIRGRHSSACSASAIYICLFHHR